jgi:hypothetical protein
MGARQFVGPSVVDMRFLISRKASGRAPHEMAGEIRKVPDVQGRALTDYPPFGYTLQVR